MGLFDFLKRKKEYDDVPLEKETRKGLSIQYNAENKFENEDDKIENRITQIKLIDEKFIVDYSDTLRSSENPSHLNNDQFHMHVEHGLPDETLPDLHLFDNTNGKATFFLNRCFTTEEQAKEAAQQVMGDFQKECPNVLFFKDSVVSNANVTNKISNTDDFYFYAGDINGKANGIQLHSTQNKIPDNLPLKVSPDKRFLYFGVLKASEAFKTTRFIENFANGYKAHKKLELPKLENPLFIRPLDQSKMGHLIPVEEGETTLLDMSKFNQSQVTPVQKEESSKFTIPISDKKKPVIDDIPRRKRKPYTRL